MSYSQTTGREFAVSLSLAVAGAGRYRDIVTAERGAEIREALDPDALLAGHYNGARVFLADDYLSGYAIREDGDLVSVWSAVKGRGDELVESAVANGAARLDCFDGYLPKFYARHGFVVDHREANWTPGGPDVVYMTREKDVRGCSCGMADYGARGHDGGAPY